MNNNCMYYNYEDSENPITDKRNLICKKRVYENINNIKYTHDSFDEFIETNYNNFDTENPFKFASDYITQSADELCNVTEYSLKPQQKFLGQLVNPNTNIKNMLIYHGLGSGKTCTGLVIGQAAVNLENKEIIFVVPAALESQYYDEIIGEFRDNKIWSCTSQCILVDSNKEYTRRFYTNVKEKSNLENLKENLRSVKQKLKDIDPNEVKKIDFLIQQQKRIISTIKTIENKILSSVSKVFRITTHDKFINSLMKRQDDELILKERLQEGSPLFKPNSMIIIDEIQNLVSESGSKYKILYNSFKYYIHPDVKKIFLTATPIYDNAHEYALTINLLNPRIPFPTTRNKFFDIFVGKIVEDDQGNITCESRDPNSKIDFNNSCIINKDLFRYISSGYVSYFKGGNPNAYPYKRTIQLFHQLVGDNKTKYIKALERDTISDILRVMRKLKNTKGGSGKSNKDKADGILLNYFDEKDSSGILPNSRQIINVAFLKETKDDFEGTTEELRELNTGLVKNLITDKLKGKSNEEIIDLLGDISIKMKSIIEYSSFSDGPIFVYSNWLSAGIEAFSSILDSLGYVKFPASGEKRYFAWSPSIEDDPAIIREARNTFNSPINKNGSLIKFMLGTSSIKEGVSFRNVKQVHILDPWWNNSRIEQITARAVRLCSHKDLEENERYVDIFKHYAVFPGYFENIEDPDVSNMFDKILAEYSNKDELSQLAADIVVKSLSWAKSLTTDQKILEISNRKDNLNNKFLKIIKEVSVDCNLFKNGNLIRLEEHIKQFSENNYQIYYKNPSTLVPFLRDDTNNILTKDDIINRTYSFPRNKTFSNTFSEAEFTEDGILEVFTGDDSIKINEEITKDLVLREDVPCWNNNNTFKEINANKPQIKQYFKDMSEIQELMPKIRKYFLLEKIDNNNSGIKFSTDNNLKKQNILKCLNSMLNNPRISKEIKDKIQKIVSSVKINPTVTPIEKIRSLVEKLGLQESEIPYYIELYNKDPVMIDNMLKQLL